MIMTDLGLILWEMSIKIEGEISGSDWLLEKLFSFSFYLYVHITNFLCRKTLLSLCVYVFASFFLFVVVVVLMSLCVYVFASFFLWYVEIMYRHAQWMISLSLSLSLYIYLFMYVCVCVYICILVRSILVCSI